MLCSLVLVWDGDEPLSSTEFPSIIYFKVYTLVHFFVNDTEISLTALVL